MTDPRTLSSMEHRCIRAHAWLRSRGSAHRDLVPVVHRRGLRTLARLGIVHITREGVYQMPGVL